VFNFGVLQHPKYRLNTALVPIDEERKEAPRKKHGVLPFKRISEDESYDGKYAIFHRAGKRNTENA